MEISFLHVHCPAKLNALPSERLWIRTRLKTEVKRKWLIDSVCKVRSRNYYLLSVLILLFLVVVYFPFLFFLFSLTAYGMVIIYDLFFRIAQSYVTNFLWPCGMRTEDERPGNHGMIDYLTFGFVLHVRTNYVFCISREMSLRQSPFYWRTTLEIEIWNILIMRRKKCLSVS